MFVGIAAGSALLFNTDIVSAKDSQTSKDEKCRVCRRERAQINKIQSKEGLAKTPAERSDKARLQKLKGRASSDGTK